MLVAPFHEHASNTVLTITVVQSLEYIDIFLTPVP